jgi:predicted nucleic acid-binding protein
MNRVVVDASAMAALAFNEPRADEVAQRLNGALVYAPTLLVYELINVAWKKARADSRQAPAILRALVAALEEDNGINWYQVSAADVALTSLATGLSGYDASYLWLAGSLGADLVTLDGRLAAAV